MTTLATAFTYTLTRARRGGTEILLTRLSDGAIKVFYQANARPEHLQRHMESLTDDCCEGFFPKSRAKAAKPTAGENKAS